MTRRKKMNDAGITNEVAFNLSMQLLQEMQLRDLITLKEYEKVRDMLIEIYQPQNNRKYDDWSGEDWITFINNK